MLAMLVMPAPVLCHRKVQNLVARASFCCRVVTRELQLNQNGQNTLQLQTEGAPYKVMMNTFILRMSN